MQEIVISGHTFLLTTPQQMDRLYPIITINRLYETHQLRRMDGPLVRSLVIDKHYVDVRKNLTIEDIMELEMKKIRNRIIEFVYPLRVEFVGMLGTYNYTERGRFYRDKEHSRFDLNISF